MTAVLIASALTLLQIFDGWTTYQVLKRGGREMNPLVQKVIDKLGIEDTLVLIKGFAVAMAWVIALVPIISKAEDLRIGLMIALTVLYVAVAINNWKALRR